MYSTIRVECAADLAWETNRSNFDKDMCEIKCFYILISSVVDIWPLDLKFTPLVTLARGDVSTKLEVSIAFLFETVRGTGQMDWHRRTGRDT